MWTEALIAVPRFVGHDVIYPKCLSWANFASFSIYEQALASLENTALISAPFYIDMILS